MWSRTVLVTCGLLAMTQTAFADPHGRYRWDDDDRPYPGPQYEYARVVNVEPLVREVRVTTPRQECWTET